MNTRSSVHVWIRSVVFLIMLLVLPQACAAQDITVAQRGADLEAAMWTGDIQKAKDILKTGPIPEANSEELCWVQAAVTLNLPSLIRPLAEAGMNVDCEDTRMTALQYALSSNRYKCAGELVRSGADVNAINLNTEGSGSSRPLNMAVLDYVGIKHRQEVFNSDWRSEDAKQARQLVRSLLDHGADPNLANKPAGTTPLAMAAQVGETEVVKWLLQAGADPNQLSRPQEGGATALEISIFNDTSNTETVEALLYAGADPTAGPHADQLLDKVKQNLPEAVPLLKQYGAK